MKPRIRTNRFGSESVTYMGVDAQKKWNRIESYGPKFVENIVQAVSRDILAYAMRTLSHCFICGHVHDELIIECDPRVSLDAICEQMGRTPPWLPNIELRADGYECGFYWSRSFNGVLSPTLFQLLFPLNDVPLRNWPAPL